MTQNQISAASLKETARHNAITEKIGKAQNKINKQHYANVDSYTSEHYERSDTAGLISANANAMNAQSNAMNAATNRKQYELAYSLEYPYGDSVIPVSAELKEAQRQNTWAQTRKADSEIALNKAQEQLNYAKAETEKATKAEKTTKAIYNTMNALFGKHSLYDVVDTVVSTD